MKRCPAPLLFAVVFLCASRATHAQTSAGIRKANDRLGDAADAVKRQIDARFRSAARDLASAAVGDGAFVAVASPWAADTGSGSVDVARFNGVAVAQRNGATYSVLLCDSGTVRPWSLTLVFATPPTELSSISSDLQLDLPDRRLYAGRATGMLTGSIAGGAFRFATVGQKSITGSGQLKFAHVRLPGARVQTPLQLGVSFKAQVVPDAAFRTACALR